MRLDDARSLALVGCLLLAGCSGEGSHALLLTVRGQSFVETFDLVVHDLRDQQLVLERRDEPVDANDPNRDISLAGHEMKLAIEFARTGTYLVHVIGHGSSAAQVALRPFQIEGTVRASLTLVALNNDLDSDNDGFPACGAYTDCRADGPIDCAYLDCDDLDATIHPFAEEVCGNGKDDDCDQGCNAAPGAGDAPCEDGDGDGVIGDEDCDDHDPCRAPTIHEAPNLCGATAADFVLPQACLDKLAREGRPIPEPPFCGDGVDQGCGGQDVPCAVDNDCDGVLPPEDCNDDDPNINPGAVERCDDDVDNNCDGRINEGCAPCDVDGDGHAARGTVDPSCKGSNGLPLPADDDDDYDAGIYPGSASATGGAEGGHVTGALREVCSRTKRNRDGDKVEAEVDHDGDGQPASADGCPPANCDADGDGFQHASCNPPKSEEDCDDTDPHTFPGAPERCGDGVDQDCNGADVPCDEDADGDGYAANADCNDDPNDPRAAVTHPWATELCDGLDNDCDGLVDEGNPDHLGQPMTASGNSCTDDNDGACGAKRGRCACSRIDPGALDEGGNRDACAGEDLAPNTTSPRCVGAGQPAPERCDNQDLDCNGRPDDPLGENLAERGQACGVARGSCTPGRVVGCDLSHPVANADLVEQRLPGFNRYWVCQDDAGNPVALPIPEVCNGKDDDCDGTLPDDERDAPPFRDGDGYIECSGCTSGSGRTDLDSSLQGCADCAPRDANVFPGHPELCNQRDDNCQDGITDDGADECVAGQLCCLTGCEDVQTDANNCGGCGLRCSTVPGTDRCVGGSCVCGSTGGPCPPSSDPCLQNECRAGSCVATPVTDCCSTAAECNDNNLCTADSCQSYRCVHDWTPGCCLRDSDCDDGDPSTKDTCNTGQHSCK